jgi:galactofuranosylgalactofuranosylrhamnosyl-N-acetylglucosaminyl-diphospho-decaprenol beta-1,5/1,6-galactofuranosyltransferase
VVIGVAVEYRSAMIDTVGPSTHPIGNSAGYVLQSLVLPDELHPETALTLRNGLGWHLSDDRALECQPGAVLALDTAYNVFSWAKWHRYCGLRDLRLSLRGRGCLCLTVTAERDPEEGTALIRRQFDVALDGVHVLDLSDWLADLGECVLHLSLAAVTPGRIEAVDWCTATPPGRMPELTLCVTTFRREAAAIATALRFDAFARVSPLSRHLHLLVVDNGHTVSLPPLEHVTLLTNRNLGGSGGFSRGLDQAIMRGGTHCLFMDDDASVDMTSITRTWTFLAYASRTDVAVAGALMKAEIPTEVWENCAQFLWSCQSRSRHADLTTRRHLLALEFESLKPQPYNLYGGFWFFAFAIEQVRHWPFPFFVRGDDINFSIANRFQIVTLPGVISFQDMDFSDKESSMTLYLDLRCDMVQHLSLEVVPWRFAKLLRTPLFFFVRSMIQNHHDSLHALNLSLEDVLLGPSFFVTHSDLIQRRAQIAAARKREIWQPLTGPLPTERRIINPLSVWQRQLMKLTLNGLFLPGFGRWGNRLVLPRNKRQLVRQCWGAAEITYVSQDGTQIMQVRHEKLSTLREGLRMLRNLARITWKYRAIRAEWQREYPALTTQEFWRGQFTPPDSGQGIS